MTKYKVYFTAIAEQWVEVEADDPDTAIDEAYNNVNPVPNFGWGEADLGEWEVPDNLPVDDVVEEIDD